MRLETGSHDPRRAMDDFATVDTASPSAHMLSRLMRPAGLKSDMWCPFSADLNLG
jgi:hypothetical protein